MTSRHPRLGAITGVCLVATFAAAATVLPEVALPADGAGARSVAPVADSDTALPVDQLTDLRRYSDPLWYPLREPIHASCAVTNCTCCSRRRPHRGSHRRNQRLVAGRTQRRHL